MDELGGGGSLMPFQFCGGLGAIFNSLTILRPMDGHVTQIFKLKLDLEPYWALKSDPESTRIPIGLN